MFSQYVICRSLFRICELQFLLSFVPACLGVSVLRDNCGVSDASVQPNAIVERVRNSRQTSTSTSSQCSSTASLPSTSSASAAVSVEHATSALSEATSVAERAAYVIEHGGVSLDVKLGVFTVRGTLEPRLVQLFPKISCTCPAAGGCYHIAAARQAIGMKDGVQRKILNLTQLRRNKRKRPDKTAGRKRPRTADVDVVAAPDADPTIAEAAVVAADDDVEPIGEQAVTIRQDICHACDSAEPPPRKNRRQREIHWIKCDDCPRWFHIICVGVRNTTAAYTCDLCA